MGTGQLLAGPRFSRCNSTTIDLSFLTFLLVVEGRPVTERFAQLFKKLESNGKQNAQQGAPKCTKMTDFGPELQPESPTCREFASADLAPIL